MMALILSTMITCGIILLLIINSIQYSMKELFEEAIYDLGREYRIKESAGTGWHIEYSFDGVSATLTLL